MLMKCFNGICLCCCSALIKLLQESVGIETCSPHFLELIMKVIILTYLLVYFKWQFNVLHEYKKVSIKILHIFKKW